MGNHNNRMNSWRHSAAWVYMIMLISSAIALLTSLILSSETLALARAPHKALGCDVNTVVSCSKVAQSWQAEFIRFGELSFPNAFFGIAAESVFVTLAVVGIAKIKLPKWLATFSWIGGLCALLYAYWLFTQSMFVIQILCPWCLVLMFCTTLQFMSLTHATFSVQEIGSKNKILSAYYRLNYDLIVDLLWIFALVLLILGKYGNAIFA
ncbi:Vitamin K epoxide reductase [Gardnerella pickettii 00703Bmash]|uniref:vitamin K epoxide reductase family protein n=1 Tax=Gardnerella pickettii TaxID=2914924 RepID=UPI00026359D5|nr:Vitamin K epoxide reductase [Gardnerella pickettii 00703Bmash]